MRHFTTLAILISAFIAVPSTVRADHDNALYSAACAYREAVREFERAVLRADFPRCEDRLVDDLEDATSVLRSAARYPDRRERLHQVWNDVRVLQARVESAIFTSGRYPYCPVLARCWQTVVIRGAHFQRELSVCRVPQHHYYQPNVYQQPNVWPSVDRTPRPPVVVQPRSNNPFGYDTYRQPFGRPATSPAPTRSQQHHQRLAVPPQPYGIDALPPSPNRVESSRRDIGHAVLGAVLTRLLN